VTEIFRGSYSGSLTTPPCTEGVTWIVSAEPIQIDLKNYETLKDFLKFNARYTQNNPGEENLLLIAATELLGA